MSSVTTGGSIAGFRSTTDTRTLFGQTMTLVAATAGFFAAGTYLGRNLSYGWVWIAYIAAFACLFGMQAAVSRAHGSATTLLFVFGTLMGVGTAPAISYYASGDPTVLWQAGGATALFMAGLGSIGYGTRRDLSAIGRLSFFALLALIVFGIVAIFVNIPNASLIYAVAGLVIFAGLTMFDFQRLRQGGNDVSYAPLMAASIFLDALNVFLFFLRIFGNRR